MLQLEPTRWFSWAFTVADDGKPLGTLEVSWRERGCRSPAGVRRRKGFASERVPPRIGWRHRGDRDQAERVPARVRHRVQRTNAAGAAVGVGRALALHEGEREVGEARARGVVAPGHGHGARHLPCRSASSCCRPCSSGSATTTPRPRGSATSPHRGPPLRPSAPARSPRRSSACGRVIVSRGLSKFALFQDSADLGCFHHACIVHRGDCFRRLVDGRLVRQPAAFLAGTLSRPWIVQAPSRVATIGVRLRPGGFTALFGASLAGTADREVPLAELPAPVTALVAAIGGARPGVRCGPPRRTLAHAAAHLPGGVPAPACAARCAHPSAARARVVACPCLPRPSGSNGAAPRPPPVCDQARHPAA